MTINIFISYHNNEEDTSFKNDLYKILKPLQLKSSISLWNQDEIKAGRHLHNEIIDTMCDIDFEAMSKNA